MPLISDEPGASRPSSVYQVFTPTTVALSAGIERPSLAGAIGSALSVPGRQLLLYGPSGSGKSTALFRELSRHRPDNHVVVRCTPTSSFSRLLRSALAQVGLDDSDRISATVHWAAVELGQRDICLVVEDAHHLPADERTILLGAMKVFSDLGSRFPGLMIVVVSASETPVAIGNYGSELGNRISEVRVSPMSTRELVAIVERGAAALGVDGSRISSAIALRSGGLASVTHHLALEVFVAAGIVAPRGVGDDAVSKTEPPVDILDEVIAQQITTMPHRIRRRFDAALGDEGSRLERSAALQALCAFDPHGARSVDIIEGMIAAGVARPQALRALAELAEQGNGPVIEPAAGGRVRFVDPLLHSYWSMMVLER